MGRKRMPAAASPEQRENQLIMYATDLAEKQLREGTASSQVITHYLKLGSSREKLERQLIEAKIENMETAKRLEETYKDAIQAMGLYAGGLDEC